jgi:hypothetical protein
MLAKVLEWEAVWPDVPLSCVLAIPWMRDVLEPAEREMSSEIRCEVGTNCICRLRLCRMTRRHLAGFQGLVPLKSGAY